MSQTQIKIHGEITQTPMVTYFDVSVPEGEKLDGKALDQVFFRYYGTTIQYPTYNEDGRQHYRIGAYKD